MNIITAPLVLLAESFTDHDDDGPIQERRDSEKRPIYAPGPLGRILTFSTILTLSVVTVGLYLTVAGGSGDIQISALGVEMATKTGGIALTGLGLIFYLVISKTILDKLYK